SKIHLKRDAKAIAQAVNRTGTPTVKSNTQRPGIFIFHCGNSPLFTPPENDRGQTEDGSDRKYLETHRDNEKTERDTEEDECSCAISVEHSY
ncbi:MAG: hypothetical protein QW115_04110, partial [Thermoplasmata archaeon]